jgi:hypothetical protein
MTRKALLIIKSGAVLILSLNSGPSKFSFSVNSVNYSR